MISHQALSAVYKLAQNVPTDPVNSVSITPPSFIPDISLGQVILNIITWALSIAGGLAVLFLIVGGVLYISATGDTERLDKAKKTIKNAITGVIFILISLVIVRTINFAITGQDTSGGQGTGTTQSTTNP